MNKDNKNCLEDPVIIKDEKSFYEENPCDKFSIDLLPERLKNYLLPLCKENAGHPILLTMSAISSVSAVMGPHMCIPWWGGLNLYPNIWAICVADSGQYKTTSMNASNEYARDHHKRVVSELKAYKNELIAESESEEDLISRTKFIMSKSPLFPAKATADAFLESKANGQRGAIFLSEVGPWLQNMEKQHNASFKGDLTDLYDCVPGWTVLTKGKGHRIIDQPYISICGYSTPEWINKFVDSDDLASGFLARFLMFRPIFQDRGPSKLPPHNAQQEFSPGYEDLKSYLNSARDSLINNPRRYIISEKAEKYIEQCYGLMHERKLKSKNKKLDPFFQRWDTTLVKLAMLMRILEDPDSNEITERSVMAAFSILNAAVHSTIYLFNNEITDPHEIKCSKVLTYIRRKCDEKGSVLWKTVMDSKCISGGADIYKPVMKTLEDRGLINVERATKQSEYIIKIPKN